uniref:C-type lectin domain-containing protein n=1 Tax=Anabas testudineus TaxID=64144 RepID=A0A7N6AZN0_ANATE
IYRFNFLSVTGGLCSLSSCVPQYNYVLFKTPKTWNDAQSYCRANCVDLATISTMEVMANVLEIVEGKYDDAAWIGLYQGTSVLWYWTLIGYDFYVHDPLFQMYFQIPDNQSINYRPGGMDRLL